MPSHRRSYLFRLESDPICRLWSGFGWLDIPPDGVEAETARYSGLDELLPLPTLKALINGTAGRYSFNLSGVAPESLRLAQEDRATVEGAALRIGYATFDAAWQLVDVVWEWLGIADVLTVDSDGTGTQRVRSIGISVAASDTRRSNPQLTFFTAADQAKISPTDRFCDQVAAISARVTRRFGPK